MHQKYMSHTYVYKIYENSITGYKCPSCNSGNLYCDEIKYEEMEESKKEREKNLDDWELEWATYQFQTSLICKNCTGTVYCSGLANVVYPCMSMCDYLDHNEEEEPPYTEFTPHFFIPSINLIEIPNACPNELKKEISSSFNLAFCDYSSAGNRIRVSLEKLMLEFFPKGDTRSLHQKIQVVEGITDETKEILTSIKWLGNTATHSANLKEFDVGYAYKALELVLKNLYCKEDKTIYELAKLINTNKDSIVKY